MDHVPRIVNGDGGNVMRRTRLSGALAVAGALVLLGGSPAVAVDADQGTWDNGDTYAFCGTGTNSRTCTYDFYAWSCTEGAAAGVALASCWFHLHGAVRVAPILSAAGKIVGCTSVALTSTGYGEYDSAFDEFDRSRIDVTHTLEVKDTFGDGKPGVAKYVFEEGGEGFEQWTASGTFVASCRSGADGWLSGGAGSVTVSVN